MSVRDYRYLIIGGTTKAATSSLFFYLKDHPEVCGSTLKEVRFFLDPDYPLSSKYRLEDGLERYQVFFNHCQDSRLRMEATPDYLYSGGTPEKIRDSLPQAKIIFILREPVSRLISWYKFARQNNFIRPDATFDDYLNMQLPRPDSGSEQHLRALEQGLYSAYLRPYFDILGPDNIYVAFYENLTLDPQGILQDIAKFARIDPSFYENYHFKVHNPTETVRSSKLHYFYKSIRFNLRQKCCDKPLVFEFLRKMKVFIEPLYRAFNLAPAENLLISPEARRILAEFYQGETLALQSLLGKTIPW